MKNKYKDEQEKFMIATNEKKLNIYFLIKTPIPSVLFFKLIFPLNFIIFYSIS